MTIYVFNQFILLLVRSKYIDLSKIDINIIIPPIRVLKVVYSFKNNHTQNGLRAISMKKNKVTSAAIRCLVANTKQQLTKPDRTAPNIKQRKKSLLDISNDPIFWNEDNAIAITPDINKHGNKSILLFILKIMVKIEKQIAAKRASMFPHSAPISKTP